MWRCNDCDRTFEEPDYIEICFEDYYGVGGMFPNKTYGAIATCPNCGLHDLEEYDEEEEEGYYEDDEK